MGGHKSSAQTAIHSNTGISKKEERSQIENLTLHLNELEKEEQKRSKESRREEIIKIRAIINESENTKQQRKINEIKS